MICPQNIVGGSVLPLLTQMADAAGDAVVLLVNARLKDVPSSAGLMSVRGRAERLEAVAAYEGVHHFRLLFANPTMPYPIRGALRRAHGGAWQVYAREVRRGEEKGWEGDTPCAPFPPPSLALHSGHRAPAGSLRARRRV